MKRFIRYLLVLFSVAVFFLGKSIESFNTELIGILFFWIVNIIYSFENIRKRIYFLMFNITFFGFLISRPVISMFKGNVWWNFEDSSVNFALNSIMLSLVFMFAGHCLCDRIIEDKSKQRKVKNCSLLRKETWQYSYFEYAQKSSFIKNLKAVSLILFYVSMFFYIIAETEKLLFMRSRNYVELYTSFKTQLPYLFTVLASMHKYILCIFLASMPSKLSAFIPLCLYILSALPALAIGLRNPIVLNVIFVFLYYFTRDSIDAITDGRKAIKKRQNKWLGKGEWSIIILIAPICMFLLGIYNYVREGSISENSGILATIVDLFYKQGVSFEVLCIGYATIPKIEYTGFVNYTFGGIIDYFMSNKVAQILWGAKDLGDGNNLNKALYSNSFSHRMSYASRGSEYLEGHGWGSSYILETYADFGYIGIILFNIFLGMLFAYMIKFIDKGSFRFTLMLVILTGIYFAPRDAALGWINFIFYLQFIVPAVVCYVAAGLCVKEYCRKNHVLRFYEGVI